MSRFKIGDRVRLTGVGWEEGDGPANIGRIYTVVGFTNEGVVRGDGYGVAAYFYDEQDFTLPWYLDESTETEWAAEIVAREEEE